MCSKDSNRWESQQFRLQGCNSRRRVQPLKDLPKCAELSPSPRHGGMAISKRCREEELCAAIVASQCGRLWASSGLLNSIMISTRFSLDIFRSCFEVHARLTRSSRGRQLLTWTINSSGSSINIGQQLVSTVTAVYFLIMTLLISSWISCSINLVFQMSLFSGSKNFDGYPGPLKQLQDYTQTNANSYQTNKTCFLHWGYLSTYVWDEISLQLPCGSYTLKCEQRVACPIAQELGCIRRTCRTCFRTVCKYVGFMVMLINAVSFTDETSCHCNSCQSRNPKKVNAPTPYLDI